MSAYDRIKLARDINRPTAKKYIDVIIDEFMEFHGDRAFADDHAIIGGIGWLDKTPVTVIGIEKGTDMESKQFRGFGSALPEGYRKAQRLMFQAEKFKRPIICFVDTQGAACGSGAEMRGVGQSIADNLAKMMTIKVPIITIIIGEGGSGGALGLAVADEVWMLENSYYSVIAPESCASILYKDPERKDEAAESLHLFAENLLELGIIEKIIKEPEDFTDDEATEEFLLKLKEDLMRNVKRLSSKRVNHLLAARYEKFRKVGRYKEIG